MCEEPYLPRLPDALPSLETDRDGLSSRTLGLGGESLYRQPLGRPWHCLRRPPCGNATARVRTGVMLSIIRRKGLRGKGSLSKSTGLRDQHNDGYDSCRAGLLTLGRVSWDGVRSQDVCLGMGRGRTLVLC